MVKHNMPAAAISQNAGHTRSRMEPKTATVDLSLLHCSVRNHSDANGHQQQPCEQRTPRIFQQRTIGVMPFSSGWVASMPVRANDARQGTHLCLAHPTGVYWCACGMPKHLHPLLEYGTRDARWTCTAGDGSRGQKCTLLQARVQRLDVVVVSSFVHSCRPTRGWDDKHQVSE